MTGELCKWCDNRCGLWDVCENDRLKDTVRNNWVAPAIFCLIAVCSIVYCVFQIDWTDLPTVAVVLTAIVTVLLVFLIFRKRRKVKYQTGIPEENFIGSVYIPDIENKPLNERHVC
jgi:hypothetical protein